MKSKFFLNLSVAAFLALSIFHSNVASAQDIALKTNLLYDATATINLGAEVGLAPRWTLDVSGNFNGWSFKEGKQWKHIMVQPEARYWFCDRFAGHFVALHAMGGIYSLANIKNNIIFLNNDYSGLSDHRYEGWFAGAGIGYGYNWVLGWHWNLEAELGVGYIFSVYDRYRCVGCGKRESENNPAHYYGPTKAAVSLIYIF